MNVEVVLIVWGSPNVMAPYMVAVRDSACKLSEIVMKPYSFIIEQPKSKKEFNKCISLVRRDVENVFGHLKARFRRIGRGKKVPLLIVYN